MINRLSHDEYMKEKIRFLVIDDEPDIVDAVGAIIEYTGNSATTYTNPLEAVSEFTQHPENYDAVITDIRMPHMSGMEVIRKIRQHSQDVPVTVITASYLGLNPQQMTQLNVARLLHKPFEFTEMQEIITSVKRRVEKAS